MGKVLAKSSKSGRQSHQYEAYSRWMKKCHEFLLRNYDGRMRLADFEKLLKEKYPEVTYTANFKREHNLHLDDRDGTTWVLAKSTLIICENHLHHQRDFAGCCDGLHMCKAKLLGYCEGEHKGTCRYNHDVSNLDLPHNQNVLRCHQLGYVNFAKLQNILKNVWPEQAKAVERSKMAAENKPRFTSSTLKPNIKQEGATSTLTQHNTSQNPLTRSVGQPDRPVVPRPPKPKSVFTEVTDRQDEIAQAQELQALILREHFGRLALADFEKLLKQKYPDIVSPIAFVTRHGECLELGDDGDGTRCVRAVSKLSICENYLHHKKGFVGSCDGLHMCKNMLVNFYCTEEYSRGTCKYNHDFFKLDAPHQQKVLRKHMLGDINYCHLSGILSYVLREQEKAAKNSQMAAENKDPLLGSSTLKSILKQKGATSLTSSNASQNQLTSSVNQRDGPAPPRPPIAKSVNTKELHGNNSSTVQNILKSKSAAVWPTVSTKGINTIKLPCGHTVPTSHGPNPYGTTLVSNSQQAQTAADSNLGSTRVVNVPVAKNYLPSDILKMELLACGSTVSEEIPTSQVEMRRYLITSHRGKFKITKYNLNPTGTAHGKYLRIETDSNGIQSLIATTELKICEQHVQHTFAECQDKKCGGLHVCKFYLLCGECMMTMQGHHCAFGHDLHTPHNQKLLEEHLLQDWDHFELQNLFSLNRSQPSCPKPCKDYNSNGRCAKGDLCTRLHCCNDYLIRNCYMGDRCQQSHNIFDMQPKNVLFMYGFETWHKEQEVFSELYECLYKNRFYDASEHEWPVISSQNKQMERLNRKLKSLGWNSLTKMLVSACVYRAQNQLDFKMEKENDNRPEICSDYLMGQCGTRCSFYHCDLPYQWQYYHAETKSWMDFPESENCETETDFCDGNDRVGYFGHDSLDILASVGFKERKLELHRNDCFYTLIRRLSTRSAGASKTERPFSTVWNWYWKDDFNQKFKYDDTTFGIVNSKLLEEMFLENPNRSIRWVSRDGSDTNYTIDFRRMVQVDGATKKEREVLRRPNHVVDAEMVKQERKRWKDKKSTNSVNDLLSISSNSNGPKNLVSTTQSMKSCRTELKPNSEDKFSEQEIAGSLQKFLVIDHRGKLQLAKVTSLFQQKYPDITVPADFRNFVCRNNRYLRIENDGHNEMVIATTKLAVCRVHVSYSCDAINCGGLHVCKFYLLKGKCKRQDDKCNFGHDLTAAHANNYKLLEKHKLSSYSLSELNVLFQLNRSKPCYPRPCKEYNNGHSCKKGNFCTQLHYCEEHLRSACEERKSCSYRHNIFHTQPLSVLSMYGFDTEQDKEQLLLELRRGIFPESYTSKRGASVSDLAESTVKSTGSSAGASSCQRLDGSTLLLCSSQVSDDSDDDSEEEPVICTLKLMGACKYGRNCLFFHCKLPYQWQRYHTELERWMNFPDKENKETEENFCDPSVDSFRFERGGWKVPSKVCFCEKEISLFYNQTITSPIRRLSTPRVTEAPADQLFTTSWNWYWRSDNGRFVKYEDRCTNKDSQTNIGSEKLEEKFENDPEGTANWSSNRYSYTINFRRMVQIKDGTIETKTVRRRPTHFVSVEMVEEERRKCSSSGMQTNFTSECIGPSFTIEKFHALWDSAAPTRSGKYQIVELSPKTKDKEYKMIKGLFHKTMPMSDYVIRKIQRIQNERLFSNYQEFRKRMCKDSSEDVKEMLLFHGTKEKSIEAICCKGFDFRLSGQTTGSQYGKGSYFATHAGFAKHYTDSDQLFVARVLVGSYTTGKPQYVRPPPKNPASPLEDDFDSCVDNVDDPQRFVIFMIDQAYPAYLIDYDDVCYSE